MKKLILFLFMLLIVSNINAQIESDITFQYRNIKADTIIKYPMTSNFQWNLALSWDTISTAPDSLYAEQKRLQDSINLYSLDTIKFKSLASTNCGDTLIYDSISDTLKTLKTFYLEADTTLRALRDSAVAVQIVYLDRDTMLKNKLDSVPIVIAGYNAIEASYIVLRDSALYKDSIIYQPFIDSVATEILTYTALRDTAYLTDTVTALLYQDTINTLLALDTLYSDSLIINYTLYNDTVQFYDSLSKTSKALTLLYKDSLNSNKILWVSNATYITSVNRLIVSNTLYYQDVHIKDSLNTLKFNFSDSLCTFYNAKLVVADTTVDYYVALREIQDSLILLSDSLIGVSLQYTIYMSNDGVLWNLYGTNFDVTTTASEGNIMFEDTNFTGKYFGLRIRSTSVTRGKIKGYLITKRNIR